MLGPIFLAAAVIVIVGIGIVGILLIRRGRQAAREEMEEERRAGARAVPAKQTLIGSPSSEVVSAPLMAEGAIPQQPVPVPLSPTVFSPAVAANSQTQGEAGYLQGVEQLLTEWRARHDISVTRPAVPANGQAPVCTQTKAVASQSPADPLGEVILELADGTGKLSGGDLKRLEVFRPESVELAVQTIQLPPHLRDDEDAALRLAQIQLYVASLGLRARWTSQAFRRGGLGDIPFSAHDFKLKIARDIMALPTADRSEVIGYLLGGLLGNPESSHQLKRAVIDTLEHMRSAALANVLLDCLDDPDPIVQEYALAAADRLLDN